MIRKAVLALSFLVSVAPLPGRADIAAAPAASTAPPAMQTLWEPGAYTSSFGVAFPLTDKPIPVIQSDDYATIFRDLMEDSLVPHYMQLQANVYPVPILGTWLKSHSPHTYKKGDLGYTGVNLVESSSTHYQDPWSVSAFFGNIADLVLPGHLRKGDDVGYSGWLVSAGAQRLKDNVLIQDKWYKLEWQVRGSADSDGEKLGWNFRIGSRFNANPYVTDVTYIGIERNNLDFRKPFLSWLDNSHFDLQLEFSHQGGRVLREEFIVGKKYPFPDRGYAITLDTGLVWDSAYEYSGPLRDNPKSDYTLVFEPGIEF